MCRWSVTTAALHLADSPGALDNLAIACAAEGEARYKAAKAAKTPPGKPGKNKAAAPKNKQKSPQPGKGKGAGPCSSGKRCDTYDRTQKCQYGDDCVFMHFDEDDKLLNPPAKKGRK